MTVGLAIEPLIKPMGFDWKLGTSMIGAFAYPSTLAPAR